MHAKCVFAVETIVSLWMQPIVRWSCCNFIAIVMAKMTKQEGGKICILKLTAMASDRMSAIREKPTCCAVQTAFACQSQLGGCAGSDWQSDGLSYCLPIQLCLDSCHSSQLAADLSCVLAMAVLTDRHVQQPCGIV